MIPTCRVICGNVFDILPTLADSSVHCCATSPPYWGLRSYLPEGHPDKAKEVGTEKTPQEYVEKLVRLFREVRRVMHPTATFWLNIGDSYAGSNMTGGNESFNASGGEDGYKQKRQFKRQSIIPDGLKPKDLIGVPWRVALALQADGWRLRQDIIWHKPAPMPSSVTDRCTTAHEYVFLLAKSARYFYDAEAIKEPLAESSKGRYDYGFGGKKSVALVEADKTGIGNRTRVVGERDTDGSANKRSVWTVATQGYSAAHFACVDEGTECLTATGWKHHDEISIGDVAAQFDMDSGLLSWATIEDVARYSVKDQPMVAAKSRDVEMLLTPNHRTVIQRRPSRGVRSMGKPIIIEAANLKTQHAVPVSALWRYEGIQPFSGDWAELIGWYLAEGCATIHSWSVEIYQSRSANPEKVDRIRCLLNAVGAEFYEASATRLWQGVANTCVAFQIRGFAATYLRQWAPDKKFHQDTLLWPDEILTRLLIGLVDGDGHRRADGRFTFIQRDKVSAGIAQAIGVRLGYATMLSKRTRNTYTVYFTNKRWITLRGTAGEGARIETQPYTGVVWCPKMPAGTWVARKNGRAFITGNTFPPKLVEPMVKAGTSFGGCCPRCLNPYERVTEKKKLKRSRPNDHVKRTGEKGTGNSCGNTVAGVEVVTLGWEPTCECNAGDPIPCTVLDPFSGAGTTGLVSLRLRRNYVGCELNEEYVKLTRERYLKEGGHGKKSWETFKG